ncbi:MAG TPA: cupin domain-containing protein [Candidatus Dormibacteraeota bacterium]|nr:cupin domain-containing protein [Candidatus Dormibacteraeota bacterium]
MQHPEPLRHIRPADLVDADPTPGMRRLQAVASDGMWAGVAHTEPRAVSGWHHHGEYETAIYVVNGALRMEHGAGGTLTMDAQPGEFIHVPRYAIHREANPTDETATLVVVRAGHGVPTINVDGPQEE